MKKYKSIQSNFNDCPFSIFLPKVTIVDAFVNIDFSVSFVGKSHPLKYMVHECTVSDKLRTKNSVKVDNVSNFINNAKAVVTVEDKKLYKRSFEFVISILTMDGDSVDITYLYEQNKPMMLKSVAIADMTDKEKDIFISAFEVAMDELAAKNSTDNKQKKEASPTNHDFDEYIKALSSELAFLKHNGGKKHKVTDGRLLTPNSNEFCYSFELESELYLSDDAPVSVIKGLDTINGTVIVCDGFQIIVSLERNIGDTVPSAQISVEPWKLLEKLRDRIKEITPNDRIAWKLFHDGPVLAAKSSDITTIKRGQDIAIQHAIREDITLVWGPPGTGKTYTMAQKAEKIVSAGKTVLIVSHSNISVDNGADIVVSTL